MATLSEQASMIARKKLAERNTRMFEIAFDIASKVFSDVFPKNNIVDYIIATYSLTILEVSWVASILDASMRTSLAFMEKYESKLIELNFPNPEE